MKRPKSGSLNKRSAILLLTGVLYLCAGCENSIDTINSLYLSDKFPGEYTEKIEILYSDSAHLKLKLTAPVVQRYTADTAYTEFPKGVKVDVYDSVGGLMSRITANYALHLESVDLVEARQDVVIINKFGEKLNTERLYWDKKAGIIRSDDFVKITTAEEIIYGDGLEANQDFTKYKITNIKGTIQVKEDEQVQ